MNNSKILASEPNAEALRLHALMKQRNEDSVRAVEEMSKHPLFWEQIQAQEEKRQRLASDADGTILPNGLPVR